MAALARTTLAASFVALVLVLPGCARGEQGKASSAASDQAAAAGPPALTAFETENGVGPVKEALVLGAPDHALAEQGEKLFAADCSACHKLDQKYVGPALGQVLQRRTPTYVMNMILDPEEMYERHPVAHQLLAEFMTQMPNLGLSRDQARALVEYLRQGSHE